MVLLFTIFRLFQRVNLGLLDKIKQSNFINFGSTTGNDSPSIMDKTVDAEIHGSQTETIKLFECPDESCVSSFVKYGNLLRHLSVGNHRQISEKMTLLDTAKKVYQERLAASTIKKVVSLSSESILFDASNFEQLPKPNTGWALPVIHPPIRFTMKQKQFLDVSNTYLSLYNHLKSPNELVNHL